MHPCSHRPEFQSQKNLKKKYPFYLHLFLLLICGDAEQMQTMLLLVFCELEGFVLITICLLKFYAPINFILPTRKIAIVLFFLHVFAQPLTNQDHLSVCLVWLAVPTFTTVIISPSISSECVFVSRSFYSECVLLYIQQQR